MDQTVQDRPVEDVRVGDTVRTSANRFPYYVIIAIDGDKAWVRNVSNGFDHVTSLSRCRRIERLS